MRTVLQAAAVSMFLAVPAYSTTIGQPFLVIENDLVGSTIDFFDGSVPSGNNEVSFSGTVSSSVGAPDLVGATFEFDTSLSRFSDGMTMSLNGETVSGPLLGRDAAFFSSYSVDKLMYELFAIPPIASAVEDPLTPGLFTFLYSGAYASFGPNVATSPELAFGIEVILDGPLDVRPFEIAPGDIIGFVDGPIAVARINVGIIGGPPVAAVPLPASAALLIAGLAGLGAASRRRRAFVLNS